MGFGQNFGGLRAEMTAALGDRFHGFAQFGAGRILDQITMCAGAYQRQHIFRLALVGQHQDAGMR